MTLLCVGTIGTENLSPILIKPLKHDCSQAMGENLMTSLEYRRILKVTREVTERIESEAQVFTRTEVVQIHSGFLEVR